MTPLPPTPRQEATTHDSSRSSAALFTFSASWDDGCCLQDNVPVQLISLSCWNQPAQDPPSSSNSTTILKRCLYCAIDPHGAENKKLPSYMSYTKAAELMYTQLNIHTERVRSFVQAFRELGGVLFTEQARLLSTQEPSVWALPMRNFPLIWQILHILLLAAIEKLAGSHVCLFTSNSSWSDVFSIGLQASASEKFCGFKTHPLKVCQVLPPTALQTEPPMLFYASPFNS